MSIHARPLPVAVLVVAFVLPLLTASPSSAARLIVRRDAGAGGLQFASARRYLEPPELAAASPGRPGARPAADGASLLVLLVLTLNSAVMLVRVARSPPSWMKE